MPRTRDVRQASDAEQFPLRQLTPRRPVSDEGVRGARPRSRGAVAGGPAAACGNALGPHERGRGALVRDAMVAAPKTLPADGTVRELRAALGNPHVVAALLVDGTAFAGAVDRDALPADAADDRPARALARTDMPTVTPDALLDEAVALLEATGLRRLVVLDRDGRTLRGLLCLTRDRSGFCRR